MKLFRTAVLAGALFVSAAGAASAADAFKDVPSNHWAKAAIDKAVASGFASGYPGGLFKPNKNVAADEFYAMLSKAIDPAALENKQGAAWDQPYLQYARDHNWTSFEPSAYLTRGQTASVIATAMGTDCGEDRSIDLLARDGVVKGKGNGDFDKDSLVTRAEAAQMINSVLTVYDLSGGLPYKKCPSSQAAENTNVSANYEISASSVKDSKVNLKGTYDKPTSVLLEVQSGDKTYQELYNSAPDGTLDTPIYLRVGYGFYNIAIYEKDASDSGNTYYGAASFLVKNEDETDRQYLLPSAAVNSDDASIIALAEQITAGKLTELDKTKAIHDWVAKNIAYDVRALNAGENHLYTAVETLQNKTAMCTGYADLTAALNRAVGIRAKVIDGDAIWTSIGETWNTDRSIGHAWVETYADGKWVIQDPTWDAGYDQGDGFVFDYSSKYFNPSPSQFEADHRQTEIAAD